MCVCVCTQVDVYRGLLETFYLSRGGPRMNQSDFSLYTTLTEDSRPAVDMVVYAAKVGLAQGCRGYDIRWEGSVGLTRGMLMWRQVRNDDRAAFEQAQGGPILDKTGVVRASASTYAPAVFCNLGMASNLLHRDIYEGMITPPKHTI